MYEMISKRSDKCLNNMKCTNRHEKRLAYFLQIIVTLPKASKRQNAPGACFDGNVVLQRFTKSKETFYILKSLSKP